MWKIILLGFVTFGIFGEIARGEEDYFKLGDYCESHEDCEDIPNAICSSDDICECADGYFKLTTADNSTCVSLPVKPGDACNATGQCSKIPAAECVNNTCVVAQAVTKLPTLAKPADECTEDSQCSFLKVCRNGTCAMPLPSLSPKTLGLDKFTLGLPCSNETDCPLEGASCVDKLCRCKEDFVTSQNLKMCLPKAKAIGDNCTEIAQCISLNGSICENEKCVDKIGKFFKNISDKIPSLLIGSTCQTDNECSHLKNALCLENVCQCSENFVTSVTANSCLEKAKKEGDPCEIYKQCEDIKGSTCVNNKCVKPVRAGTLLGSGKSGSAGRTLSELIAAILFIKIFFV